MFSSLFKNFKPSKKPRPGILVLPCKLGGALRQPWDLRMKGRGGRDFFSLAPHCAVLGILRRLVTLTTHTSAPPCAYCPHKHCVCLTHQPGTQTTAPATICPLSPCPISGSPSVLLHFGLSSLGLRVPPFPVKSLATTPLNEMLNFSAPFELSISQSTHSLAILPTESAWSQPGCPCMPVLSLSDNWGILHLCRFRGPQMLFPWRPTQPLSASVHTQNTRT